MMSKIFFVLLVIGSTAKCEELDPILLVKQFFAPAPSTGSTSGSSGSSGSSGGSPATTTTVAPAGSTTTFTPDPLCLNNPTRPTPTQCCIPATDLTNCPATPPAAGPDPLCAPACTNTTLCLAATDAKCVAPTTPATGGSPAPATPGTVSYRPLISASGPASG